MNIALFDLKKQYSEIKEEIKSALDEVLESQFFIGGPCVEKLEAQLASYCGVPAAAGMSSGTDALIAALMALGIYRSPLDKNEPDEVIVPAYTFFATAGAVWRVGARPVFVDIDPVTFNMDEKLLESKITPRTKAIIPVHLFGQCANMRPICEIAKKHKLFVIEDCAQSIGAMQDGKQSGSFGDCGCLSFFPTKNLGGLGDGGMIVSQNSSVIAESKRIRNHGMEPKYYHKTVGGNFRLDAIQAAALSVKLKYLDKWASMRTLNAAFYDKAFAGNKNIITPKILPQNKSVYNQYIVRIANRDECLAKLKQDGIGTEIYYPMPLHIQECFAPLGYKAGDFPVSEEVAKTSLALPIYSELPREQMEYVAEKLNAFAV